MLLLPYLLASLNLLRSVSGLAEVHLGGTKLSGSSLPELGQEFFAGIPFAEPPVGPLRFSPPVLKLDPGVSTFDATEFGAPCMQDLGSVSSTAPLDSISAVPLDNITTSEDCLTLNVQRPAGINATSALPVMVWVYGGGFGEGSALLYNGSAIVLQSVQRGTPIIYVTLNYRLGPLGFPQGIEAEETGATNLGNKDVIAALTWVQNNIGAFGGDKEKVTMFGESAGAAAILESGSAASHILIHAPFREDTWQDFVSGVPECAGASSTNKTFDCLRAASSETIFNATKLTLSRSQEQFPFSPVIDGPGGIIPDLPSELFKRGEFARIPSISGTTLDEGTLFIPTTFNSTAQLQLWLSNNSTLSSVSYLERDLVYRTIPDLYPDIPALGSPFGTGNETFGLSSQFKRAAAVFGDIAFTSLRRQWTKAASQHGAKVFAYLFTDPQTSTLPPFLGVGHGSELFYVFGAPQNGPESVTLSQTMIDYWVSFATSFDPNDGYGNTSRPAWTQYTPESENVMELNSESLGLILDNFREEQIEFLNAHPEALLH